MREYKVTVSVSGTEIFYVTARDKGEAGEKVQMGKADYSRVLDWNTTVEEVEEVEDDIHI